MQWITIIFLGVAANLDNLGIGLAYGVKKTRIPLYSNLVIACVSMIVTFIAVLAGSTIIEYVSPRTANIVGSLLICFIGLWMLNPLNSAKKVALENPELIDVDRNHIISFREALTLGFILSANCLASGVGMGANGISTLWTVLSIGFFSVVTIAASSYFGSILSKTLIGRFPSEIAGGLLIVIGIFEMLI
ncbi:manganese efflux pump [Sporosarcina sp. CAU 1771]